MRLVFTDTETGGLDPLRHPLIQIAAVAVDAELSELESFECKLDFDLATAEAGALEKNSYDPDVWAREAIDPREAVHLFSRFLKRYADVEMVSQRTGRPYSVAQLVGHNALTFDGPFIQALYRSHDAFLPGSFRVMDTCQLAIWWFHCRPTWKQPKDFKLGTLCEHFGIPLIEAHDALADVRATVELCRVLAKESKGAAA